MRDIESTLRSWAHEHGCAVAVGSREVIHEAIADIRSRRESGQLDASFFDKGLSWLPVDRRPGEGETGPADRGVVIVIAWPRPAHLLRFHFPGGPLDTIVPPTYAYYERTAADVSESFRAEVLDDGDALEPLKAPLKAVASRLGLVVYGRNNITYAPGLGSYHQLVGFTIDRPLNPTGPIGPSSSVGPSPRVEEREGKDHLPGSLPQCEKCRLCLEACPTGALSPDRFLARAERCLTLVNEYEGPWPDWVEPAFHNSLVGCMSCQERCPANAGLLRFERLPVAFSLEETRTVLAGPDRSDPDEWAVVRSKFTQAGLGHEEPCLSRNLKALVAARAPGLAADLGT